MCIWIIADSFGIWNFNEFFWITLCLGVCDGAGWCGMVWVCVHMRVSVCAHGGGPPINAMRRQPQLSCEAEDEGTTTKLS